MNKRRGSTLIELQMGLLIMGVLLALGAAMFTRVRGANEHTMALEVASRLRAVRQRALTRHAYNGVLLSSHAMALVEGYTRGQITRSFDFSREHPDTELMASDVALTGLAADWLGPLRNQRALLFDAQGKPEGCKTLIFQGSAPWRIQVGSDGRVEVDKLERGQATASYGLDQASWGSARSDNHAPVLSALSVSPRVGASLLTDGVEAIIPFNSYVTLRATASDVDGDRLYVRWGSGRDGTFTCGSEQPMERTPNGNWVAETHFRPADWTQTTPIELKARVRDEAGLAAQETDSLAVSAMIGMPGTIAFKGYPNGQPDSTPGYWGCTPEGHRVRRLLPEIETFAELSQDGEKIVFDQAGSNSVFLANGDGSGRVELLAQPLKNASVSPRGDFVAGFYMNGSAPDRIAVYSTVGTLLGSHSLGGNRAIPRLVWDQDNFHIFYQVRDSGSVALQQADTDGMRSVIQARVKRLDIRAMSTPPQEYDWAGEPVGSLLSFDQKKGRVRNFNPATGVVRRYNFNSATADTVSVAHMDSNDRTPVAGSPFSGTSFIVEGWDVADSAFNGVVSSPDSFKGYTLSLPDADSLRFLRPNLVKPLPCLPIWARR